MKTRSTLLLLIIISLCMASLVSFASRPIKGTVTYHDDISNPIPSVEVELLNAPDGEVLATTTTNFNGKYIFPDVEYGTYYVRALTTPILAGGFDMGDHAMILAIANNSYTPTEIERLAADVDGSGSVTTDDADFFLLNYVPGFQPDWVFGEGQVVVHNGNKTNVPTMTGSSSGDVNGTFVPTTRNEILSEVNYFSKLYSANFTIEVYAKDLNAASAMGLVVDYPATVNVKSVKSNIGELADLKTENGQVVATWVNNGLMDKAINSSEPLIVITASTNKSYNGGDIRFTVNNKSNFLKGGEVARPVYTMPYLSMTGNDNLSQCYPNPANNVTTVYFTLPTSSKAKIEIYNLNGQLVKTVLNENMNEGYHSLNINVTDLKEGVYFCNFKTSGNTNINETKRLIVVH